MKIALVQQAASPDREANVSRGLAAMEEAARRGARLVVFPELAFTTFLPVRPAGPDTLASAEPVPGPTTDRFRAKARELGVVAVLKPGLFIRVRRENPERPVSLGTRRAEPWRRVRQHVEEARPEDARNGGPIWVCSRSLVNNPG